MRTQAKSRRFEQVQISVEHKDYPTRETAKRMAWGTWYRVMENDGSTVAYCPDIVTAQYIVDYAKAGAT